MVINSITLYFGGGQFLKIKKSREAISIYTLLTYQSIIRSSVII